MLKSRRVRAGIVAFALLAPATVACGASASEAAKACRQLDENGVLSQPEINVTRGECVNILKGQPDGRSGSFIAGACGLDIIQREVGVTNKGACIDALRAAMSTTTTLV